MSLPVLVTRRPTIVRGRSRTSEFRARRSELNIVGRAKAPVGHFHHPRLGVRGGRSGLLVLLLARVAEGLNRGDGGFDTPLIVESSGNSCQLLARRRVLIRFREDGLEVQRCLLAAVEKRRFATERRRRCAGTDPRTVLRHASERQQALVQQRAEHVRHQRLQRLAMLHAKCRQSRVAHLLVPHDPSEGIVRQRPACDLSRAADAVRDRVQPQCQLHRRAEHLATRAAFHRLGLCAERRQIQRVQHPPDQPSPVIFRQCVFRNLEANDSLRAHRLRHAHARSRRFAHAAVP